MANAASTGVAVEKSMPKCPGTAAFGAQGAPTEQVGGRNSAED